MQKTAKRILLITLLSVIATIFSIVTLGGGFAFAADSTAETVYLGGTPIGIVASSDGLVVYDLVSVVTAKGEFSPALTAGIQKGDILLKVDGEEVEDVGRLNELVKNSEGELVLTVKRGDTLEDIRLTPVFDLSQNAKKIGMVVRNELVGIGTLTFIKNNMRYGCLGHQIMDAFGHGGIYGEGKVYPCTVTGYVPGEQGKAGSLRGTVHYDKNAIGTIDKNSVLGLYGTMNQSTERIAVQTMSRHEVKAGKAQIRTTIGEEGAKFYDVEIIKASNQNSAKEKGLVIRITDEELLSKTNGILQGMSGSPILQNGKLVGAVTHVFLNDPTKGYGLYIDFMLNN